MGEDAEAVKRRKKRVKRKEVIQRYDTMDGSMSNKNKINKTDASAIKILEKLRNKNRKKPKLSKAHTLDSGTNFGSFYMDKGMKIAPLQKKSSSFLFHREKCIERVKLAENKSQSITGVATSVSAGSNQNRFLFQRVSNTKKRKRDNESCGQQNMSKKRK